MALTDVLLLIGLSLGVALLCRYERTRHLRNPLLLIVSVVVIFWLQPALPIRGLDFWLPCATLALTILGWALTSSPGENDRRATIVTMLIVAGSVLLLSLTRFLAMNGTITASRPPQTLTVLLVLLSGSGALLVLSLAGRRFRSSLGLAIFLLLLLFLVLKLPVLTLTLSTWLRGLTGQSRELASALDIRWLGFSYIAFRLIHTLRDRQAGRLPQMSLQEYLVYILFFPAISAGPIDRSERFIKDLRTNYSTSAQDFGSGITRLVIGLFMKFVLADTLALFSLNGTNGAQVDSAGWLWLLLVAYSLQIYFDFSGYTSIAIGMGRLMGIRLPENFRAPYLKPNLTRFWDSWHITLTQWFRAYFFFPLTRFFRTQAKWLPAWLVMLLTQLATMVLIGLWHGVTVNFALWGLWHGVGLFIQNRWSSWTQPVATRLQKMPILNGVKTALSVALTFTYVTLGWVWFTIPDPELAMRVLGRVLGFGGWQ